MQDNKLKFSDQAQAGTSGYDLVKLIHYDDKDFKFGSGKYLCSTTKRAKGTKPITSLYLPNHYEGKDRPYWKCHGSGYFATDEEGNKITGTHMVNNPIGKANERGIGICVNGGDGGNRAAKDSDKINYDSVGKDGYYKGDGVYVYIGTDGAAAHYHEARWDGNMLHDFGKALQKHPCTKGFAFGPKNNVYYRSKSKHNVCKNKSYCYSGGTVDYNKLFGTNGHRVHNCIGNNMDKYHWAGTKYYTK